MCVVRREVWPQALVSESQMRDDMSPRTVSQVSANGTSPKTSRLLLLLCDVAVGFRVLKVDVKCFCGTTVITVPCGKFFVVVYQLNDLRAYVVLALRCREAVSTGSLLSHYAIGTTSRPEHTFLLTASPLQNVRCDAESFPSATILSARYARAFLSIPSRHIYAACSLCSHIPAISVCAQRKLDSYPVATGCNNSS